MICTWNRPNIVLYDTLLCEIDGRHVFLFGKCISHRLIWDIFEKEIWVFFFGAPIWYLLIKIFNSFFAQSYTDFLKLTFQVFIKIPWFSQISTVIWRYQLFAHCVKTAVDFYEHILGRCSFNRILLRMKIDLRFDHQFTIFSQILKSTSTFRKIEHLIFDFFWTHLRNMNTTFFTFTEFFIHLYLV